MYYIHVNNIHFFNQISNEAGMKRELESEFQSNEKKFKVDTVNVQKEIELNDETGALFEEQFKSWEEQFLKWKEQNKDHPDKVKYILSPLYILLIYLIYGNKIRHLCIQRKIMLYFIIGR